MSKLWEQQCDAALDIRERHGLEKALGYLIGEKFLNLLEYSKEHVEVRLDVQDFAERIRRDWPSGQLLSYFKNVERVGAQGHVLDDETFKYMQGKGVFAEGPSEWAEQLLLLEQARKMLLPS